MTEEREMKLNPKKLIWEAPTTNSDGSAIRYELEYEVGVLMGDEMYEPILTVPGQLRVGQLYEAQIAHFALEAGEHVIALRSFAKGDPERRSEWSESVVFRIAEVPSAPLGLRVA